MDDILEGLRTIIDNPDDLSELPNYINKLEEARTRYTERQEQDLERITKLQNANHNLLSQIPVKGAEPEIEPKDDTPTFEDAQKELLNAMNNMGGN